MNPRKFQHIFYQHREAASVIMNAEHRRVQRLSTDKMERFADALRGFTTQYWEPKPHAFERFQEWLRAQRSIHKTVLVLGVTDSASLRLFERHGAVVSSDGESMSELVRHCRNFE